MNEQQTINEAADGQSGLTDGLADDLAYLRENLTEAQIACVFAAATTLSGTSQHSRAMHIMVQELPPLALYGILKRAFRVANANVTGWFGAPAENQSR